MAFSQNQYPEDNPEDTRKSRASGLVAGFSSGAFELCNVRLIENSGSWAFFLLFYINCCIDIELNIANKIEASGWFDKMAVQLYFFS